MGLLGDREERMSNLFGQLAVMLEAGIPIAGALRSLSEQQSGSTRAALQRIEQGIGGGASLAEAVNAEAGPGRLLTVFEARVLAAGEASGALPENIHRLEKDLDRQAAAKRKTMARLAYPLILIHAAILIPATPILFTAGLTAFLRVAAIGLGSLWGTILVLAYGVGLLRRAPPTAEIVDGIALRLPWLGTLFQARAASDFVAALQAVYSAGIPVIEGLGFSAEACRNAVFQRKLAEVARKVEKGMTVAEALESAGGGTFPPIVLEMVRTGETSGKLDFTLKKAGDYLLDTYERRLDWTIRIGTGLVYGLAMCLAAAQIISFWTGRFEQIRDALGP